MRDVEHKKSRELNSETYAMRAVMQQGSNGWHGHGKIDFFLLLLAVNGCVPRKIKKIKTCVLNSRQRNL